MTSPLNYLPLEKGSYHSEAFLSQDWNQSPVVESMQLRIYKQLIRSVTSVDPYYLLNKQRDIFQKLFPKDAQKMTSILEGDFGQIFKGGCVENALLDHQVKNFGASTEFLAYIFQKKVNGKLQYKLRVITQNTVYVGGKPQFQSLVDKDLSDGWQLIIHLHNHPFFLKNSSGDIAGTVVPSGPDINTYIALSKTLNLQEAWVTNGFNTLRLPRYQFHMFKPD